LKSYRCDECGAEFAVALDTVTVDQGDDGLCCPSCVAPVDEASDAQDDDDGWED
jgi:DNA-directed RNA polymerase subunit RPC12/RpoP